MDQVHNHEGRNDSDSSAVCIGRGIDPHHSPENNSAQYYSAWHRKEAHAGSLDFLWSTKDPFKASPDYRSLRNSGVNPMEDSMNGQFSLVQIVEVTLTVLLGGVLVYLIYRTARRTGTEDAGIRLVLTVPVVAAYIFILSMPLHPMIPILAAVVGVVMAFIWGGPFIKTITHPFTNAFMPDEELEDAPNYSPALRLRNQGSYIQATEAINEELQKFPDDLQGHLLKAQIWAKNRREPTEAIALLEEYLASEKPRSSGTQIVALNQLAEICISELKDFPRATEYFRVITRKFPDSEAALEADQRIAQLSLPSAARAIEPIQPFHVEKSDRDYGLEFGRGYMADHMKKPVEDMPIDELLEHLHEHPRNFSARRDLVQRLAFELDRSDEAMTWVQETLEIPHQSRKQRAEWYNLLADIQIRKLQNVDAARMTLKRLIDEDPECAAAAMARNRMATIRRELEPFRKKSTIQIGTYEDDIGLKQPRNQR